MLAWEDDMIAISIYSMNWERRTGEGHSSRVLMLIVVCDQEQGREEGISATAAAAESNQ